MCLTSCSLSLMHAYNTSSLRKKLVTQQGSTPKGKTEEVEEEHSWDNDSHNTCLRLSINNKYLGFTHIYHSTTEGNTYYNVVSCIKLDIQVH